MGALRCRRAVGYLPENAPFYPELGVEGYLHFVARMTSLGRFSALALVLTLPENVPGGANRQDLAKPIRARFC